MVSPRRFFRRSWGAKCVRNEGLSRRPYRGPLSILRLARMLLGGLRRPLVCHPGARLVNRAVLSGTLDLVVRDLAVRLLLPDIHHVVRTGDIALLVVSQFADHGLELLTRVHHFGDLLGIKRLRLL